MERHVKLLRILVGLWGGLAMLVGVSMLLLAAGAWAEFRQSLGTAVEFAAGLTTRPLDETVRDTLAWVRSGEAPADPPAGLAKEKEQAVLDEWLSKE